MRVIVLGGTWFVGRAITEALVAAGHDVLVAHRGSTEPADLVRVEHLELEEAYLAVGATILRLGVVYGEHDYQRRFEPVLRRIRAGRRELPIGTGGFLWSRVYAGDVGQAVLASLGGEGAAGECLNIVEGQTSPMRLFYEQVIGAAGARLDLVRVPDQLLPPDLETTGALSQHLLASPAKAAELLGWRATGSHEGLRRAVCWHLDHPPSDPDTGFSADEAALTSRIAAG